MFRAVMTIIRSPTQGIPPERDNKYDKLEFVQPQEEIIIVHTTVWKYLLIGYI